MNMTGRVTKNSFTMLWPFKAHKKVIDFDSRQIAFPFNFAMPISH